MNSAQTHQSHSTATSTPNTYSTQYQSSATQPTTLTSQNHLTDQFKAISIQNQSTTNSTTSGNTTQVPNQTANNKENSKKTNESNASGVSSHGGVGKVALKPREFGREITNAATGSALTTAGSNSTHTNKLPTQNTSAIIEHSTNIHISQQSTQQAVGGGILGQKKSIDAHGPTNITSKTSQVPNRTTSQRNATTASGAINSQIGNSVNTSNNPIKTAGQHIMQKKKSTGQVCAVQGTVGPHCVSTASDQLKSKFTSQESTESSHHSANSSSSSTNKSDSKSTEENKKKQCSSEENKDGVVDVTQKCKDRLAQFRKTIIKDMVLNDQLDLRNPQCVAEFAQEIYESMKELEQYYRIDHEYLSKNQQEIKDTSRAFLVEWIIDVHRKFRLMPETLYVTVNIIDRYLSLQQIKKSELHLLGVTALLISTKYEEIYPPELKDLLNISENKFNKSDVLKMESKILSTLEFNFMFPSSLRFLERFRKLSAVVQYDEQIFYFAQYINEISLLDSSLLKYKQSELAAASLILAAKSVKRVSVWNKEMEKCTGYKEDDLKSAIEDVKSFAYEVNPKFLQTLKYKFSKPEFFEVANIPFKF